MLTPEQIAEFRRDGFLYGGPVLTEAEVAELQDALARCSAGDSPKAAEANRNISWEKSKGYVVTQIVNIWEAEPAFYRHLFNDRIVPMVAQLMGTDTVRVWHDQIQVKPAKVGGPTVWHQDYPYWPVIQPADLVSAWVALEDATIENGCMSMVRRSHTWGTYSRQAGEGTIGIIPETWGPDYDLASIPAGESVEVVPVEVPRGAVVFHHCMTWHGAPVNASSNARPAIAVHFMPGGTRYQPGEKSHLVEHHITVRPGEILQGDHFPTVMENGRVLTPGER